MAAGFATKAPAMGTIDAESISPSARGAIMAQLLGKIYQKNTFQLATSGTTKLATEESVPDKNRGASNCGLGARVVAVVCWLLTSVALGNLGCVRYPRKPQLDVIDGTVAP